MNGEQLIVDVIIKFNRIESKMKKIISNYISSERKDFVNDFLLNNLISNFFTKYKLLKYIIKDSNITVDKDFDRAMKILMNIRNSVAHSDRLDQKIVVDVDFNGDGLGFPIYGLDPEIVEVQNENMNIEKLDDKIKVFNKYFELVDNNLDILLKDLSE